MIRCGKLCKDCHGGECRDNGRRKMECVACHGKGCDLCDHGSVIEAGCPQRDVGPVVSTLTMIDMAEKGHLPVTGGVLDQSQWFVEAYKFYTADIATIKAEA